MTSGPDHGEGAADALALANLPLATFFVRRFAPPHLHHDDDLHQAARMGLLLAARTWPGPQRCLFSTWAGGWVRRAVCEALCERDLVAVPRHAPAEERREMRRRLRPGRVDSGGNRHRGDSHPASSGPAPDADALREDLADAVRGAVAGLPERQALVLVLRLEGMTLEATGARLGVTAERARQIEARALEALRRGRPDLEELLD